MGPGMKLTELIQKLNLSVRSAKAHLDREVTGGYASDLLSDVLANSKEGNLWITLQVHQNIVGVAGMKELAGIILVNNLESLSWKHWRKQSQKKGTNSTKDRGIDQSVKTILHF